MKNRLHCSCFVQMAIWKLEGFKSTCCYFTEWTNKQCATGKYFILYDWKTGNYSSVVWLISDFRSLEWVQRKNRLSTDVKVKTNLGNILDGNSCWGAFIIDFCCKELASKELRDTKFALTIKVTPILFNLLVQSLLIVLTNLSLFVNLFLVFFFNRFFLSFSVPVTCFICFTVLFKIAWRSQHFERRGATLSRFTTDITDRLLMFIYRHFPHKFCGFRNYAIFEAFFTNNLLNGSHFCCRNWMII